jgi:integrase
VATRSKKSNPYQLPSGRWRARLTVNGVRESILFETEKEGKDWLISRKAAVVEGRARPASRGRRTVGSYFAEFMKITELAPGTQRLYRNNWRLHAQEFWTDVEVRDVTLAMVMDWHAYKVEAGTKPTVLSQTYRNLRSLFNLALDREDVDRNPCRIKGADKVQPKRPGKRIPIADVLTMAAVMLPRYRAWVLLAAFTGLRFGESTGLRRQDFNADLTVVTVTSQRHEKEVGGRLKTITSERPVVVTAFVRPYLRDHMAEFTGPEADAIVFPTRNGSLVGNSNLRQTMLRAIKKSGLPACRIHDLRHTALSLAGDAGANVFEVMAQGGHADPSTAGIYAHTSNARAMEIAANVHGMIVAAAQADWPRAGHETDTPASA